MTAYKHNSYASEFAARCVEHWKAIIDGRIPPAPYQVEIHPTAACPLRCVDCHGQHLRGSFTKPLPMELLTTLLSDISQMGTKSVVYSGVYSDPAADESRLAALLATGADRWGVKLHTSGLLLTPLVRTAAIDLADFDSYLSISKMTVDPLIYAKLCRPIGDPESALAKEQENLAALFHELRPPLTVSFNCRVNRITAPGLPNLLRWFQDNSPLLIRLRFTADYKPTLATGNTDWMMPASEAAETVWHAAKQARFQSMERLSFRYTDGLYAGATCYHQYLIAAVGADGMVYPCPAIAGDGFKHLAYGDLRRHRFPTIWKNVVNSQPIGQCPRCVAACEKQLNTALDQEIKQQWNPTKS